MVAYIPAKKGEILIPYSDKSDSFNLIPVFLSAFIVFLYFALSKLISAPHE
jgi:hypothetical protein